MYSVGWKEMIGPEAIISDWSEYYYVNKRILPKTNELLRENASIVLDDLVDLSSDILETVKSRGLSDKTIRLTPRKTIFLVSNILNEINPDLKKFFDDERRIGDLGSIIIYPKRREKKLKRKFLKEKKYFEAQCFDEAVYRLITDNTSGRSIVKCPLEGNITDVIAIVHETIHLYSRKYALNSGYPTYIHKKSILSEVPSIYFEKYAADYLVSLGYDKDLVYSSYLDRTIDNLFASTYYLAELDILNTYQNHSSISNDNLMIDERIPKIINNLISLESYVGDGYSDVRRDLYKLSNYWRDNDKKSYVCWWASTTECLKDVDHFGYILGRCYANKLEYDKETFDGMLEVASGVNLPINVLKDKDLFVSLGNLSKSNDKVKIKS